MDFLAEVDWVKSDISINNIYSTAKFLYLKDGDERGLVYDFNLDFYIGSSKIFYISSKGYTSEIGNHTTGSIREKRTIELEFVINVEEFVQKVCSEFAKRSAIILRNKGFTITDELMDNKIRETKNILVILHKRLYAELLALIGPYLPS